MSTLTPPIRWGILGVAKIALKQVIPAMQQGKLTTVTAIASRDLHRAEAAAEDLGIPKAYGSYEELLADPEVDAVYNPLPNHLHVPWTLKALQAGKHVLCEKPIALDVSEAKALMTAAATYPGMRVMEAFMYRFHPQWIRARTLVREGAIGEVHAIHAHFSYYNDDPGNIRNQAEIGGGGLMDIGCYCISWPRFILDAEPVKVTGLVELDPVLGVDRVTSGLLDFSGVQATFTCSTQMAPYQRVLVHGTTGRLEVLIPANAPAGEATRILIQTAGAPARELLVEAANQYTLQGDAFSRAILEGKEVPTPLGDAVSNMEVIDAVVRGAKEGRWVNL
ncbi:Gfo/Idh/MocA family protein [Dinghuibacter silviterrae]|uniref:Putative dehydrogenase n=1 Tax=Dinghuibacter silviterrae TaxID=1539049 RepID=A0A4R8DVC4_9BACT|nr:Gfo/Idh/MocA family oxidoreductase [Dinghuibacter silviterrae]TDX01868.1 putative dehydrogenase [Dinghuibacter silviterrae]